MTGTLTQLIEQAKQVEKKIEELQVIIERLAGKMNGVSLTAPEPRLTRQEIKIIKLINENKTLDEIAGRLKLSKRTIETHRYNIIKKVGLKSVHEVSDFAKKFVR